MNKLANTQHKKEDVTRTSNNVQVKIIETEQAISSKNQSFYDLSARLRSIKNEISEKEAKLEKLQTENSNYEIESTNVKKSLETASNNLTDFRKIYSEYNTKVEEVDSKFDSVITDEKNIQNQIKVAKDKLSSQADLLKRVTPSATIMVDMAEDNVLNAEKEDTRWKNIIEKIISN